MKLKSTEIILTPQQQTSVKEEKPMDNVFTETDSEKIDALLYTAIFNEVDRLKKSVGLL